VTFAHDQARTGFETQSTGLATCNVSQLGVKWQVNLGEPVYASPIVAGGVVYVATSCPNDPTIPCPDGAWVYALSAATGAVQWQTDVGNGVAGNGVHMTPALINGILFVGTYGYNPNAFYGDANNPVTPTGASFEALDPAAQGHIIWHVSMPGTVRAEPVVSNGVVYESNAGGDETTGCVNGSLYAFNISTGTQVQQPSFPWTVSPTPKNGAGIWAPLSLDGTNLYFGTGNACDDDNNGYSPTTPLEESEVAFSTTGTPAMQWAFQAALITPGFDTDVGGGLMIRNGVGYVETKSGTDYALNLATGASLWHSTNPELMPYTPGAGSIGTPTGDGNMVIFSSGELNSTPTSGSNMVAYSLNSDGTPNNALYALTSQQAVQSGYVAFVPGIGISALDQNMIAFDSTTGQRLWTSPQTADDFYASPAVVPSGIYNADMSGNVYAYQLNPTSTQARYRRMLRVLPHTARPFRGSAGFRRSRFK
jgi:outer membrane protein assembly factor BamB